MEILDLLEVLAYCAAFWLFLFSRDIRRRQSLRFREAGVFGRCALGFHGATATTCGLLPILALELIFSA